MDSYLEDLLSKALAMRRSVMDEDIELVKKVLWNEEMSRRKLTVTIADMITNRDYQSAKRWIEENLIGRPWFSEYKNDKKGGRGRRGVKVFIGYREKQTSENENPQKIIWGEASAK